MSSTSAVAVLAQGLRELRDFAEGPDGEELQQGTGLTSDQIETALGGEQLPTREVTLALVEAWEGDVEAWRDYWGQISELAGEEDGTGAKPTAATPTPPEPSIITPIPEVEPESAETETEAETEIEAEADAEAETEAETETEAEAEAEASGGGESIAAEDPDGEDEQEPAVREAARAESDSGGEDAAEAAADGAGPGQPQQEAVEEEPASVAGAAPEKSIPAQRTPESAEQAAKAQPSSVLEGVVVASGTPRAAKKGMLARVGIPVLLFAVGVGVGAFGDHALNSKQSSSDSTASVPPVSVSSKPSHSAASSASSAASAASSPSGTSSSVGESASSTDSASAGGTGTDTGSSASTSSTVAPGTVLGNYVNIQLAAGYSVNFLSDPYHPLSGTAHGPDAMGFFADSFLDGRFYAGRVAILNSTDTGSYTSCLNDTRYQTDVLLTQVSAGGSFCITTDTGHLVLVTVKRMPSSTDANPYAVLDITVWQGN